MGDIVKETSRKHLHGGCSPENSQRKQCKTAQSFPNFEEDNKEIQKAKEHKPIRTKTSGTTDIKAKTDERSLSISPKNAHKDLSKAVSLE